MLFCILRQIISVDDTSVCKNGIQVICRHRDNNFPYGPEETYKFLTCVGEKVTCFDLSNDTKIWEYICPPHTNDSVEAFTLVEGKLIKFPQNLERYFPNLKAIALEDNLMTDISNGDLISHTKLEYLSFSRNKI